jgi:hypothetical protein
VTHFITPSGPSDNHHHAGYLQREQQRRDAADRRTYSYGTYSPSSGTYSQPPRRMGLGKIVLLIVALLTFVVMFAGAAGFIT